jgi:membrane associated rhomboid family serine protease
VIPLRDDVPSRTFPFVNLTLILANVFVFMMELGMGARLDRFIFRAGVIPALYTGPRGALGPLEVVFTVLDPALGSRILLSMFLHAGWAHILGNMLYLWIFGDNVEDRMGHLRYLAFYLIAGWGAAYTHILVEPASQIPSIGASGAIAGVLGAYCVLYPRARVVVALPPPFLFFFPLFQVPAVFVLGFWFLQQFVLGSLSLLAGPGGTGGVAWGAHVGGFLLGLALVGFFQKPTRRPASRDLWWAERARGRRPRGW